MEFSPLEEYPPYLEKKEVIEKEVSKIAKVLKPVEEVVELPIDIVDPPSELIRQDVDEEELEELRKSIEKIGQRKPIDVVKKGDRYEIVDGHMRWLACKSLGKQTIKAIVREYSDVEIAREKLHSNIARVTQDPIGEAKYYQKKMADWGVNTSQLAAMLNISESRIKQRLELLTFPPELQEAVQKREISIAAAQWLNRVPHPDIKRVLIDAAIKSGVTASQAEIWYYRYKDMPLFAPPPTKEEIQQDLKEMEIYMLTPCQVCGEKVKREEWAFIEGHKDCLEFSKLISYEVVESQIDFDKYDYYELALVLRRFLEKKKKEKEERLRELKERLGEKDVRTIEKEEELGGGYPIDTINQ